MINESIKDYDWLSIDPYPALYLPTDVNFTVVIERLEKYIEYHLGVKIPIFFIFGSDNVNFVKTFTKQGNFCVVDRGSNPESCKWINLINDGRRYFVYNNNPSASSNLKVIRPTQKEKLFLRYDLPQDNPFVFELERVFLDEFKSVHFEFLLKQKENFEKLPENTISLDKMLQVIIKIKFYQFIIKQNLIYQKKLQKKQ